MKKSEDTEDLARTQKRANEMRGLARKKVVQDRAAQKRQDLDSAEGRTQERKTERDRPFGYERPPG